MLLVASAQGALVQAGAALALGAVLVGVGVVRRRASGSATGRRLPLGPQHAVHVVEVEGRRYLMGTGPGAAPQILDRLPDRASAAPAAAPAPSPAEPPGVGVGGH